ncbi:hypothetical protein BwSH20_76210 [Bradyrhizobium ottawaense]|nr:hypothetical protein BJA01nite_85870 [Bradyrhizobium japonicum]GMO10520.1 hypothetical protein BwSF19_76910 [Bradyrhizobium ottawaense]GMO10892.1 hypothetical protein BwSH20_76210 [Bradyrhizobium ottawaense]GMO11043.1 hypothetical protein BwSH12_77700 [Bradyrhizobium ottawaense]GMO53522.1 hypothetical protein BwSF21_77550 [Bradyrhizobium ottawaense]
MLSASMGEISQTKALLSASIKTCGPKAVPLGFDAIINVKLILTPAEVVKL